MGIYFYLLGWRRLLDFTITFGDSNYVTAACNTNGVDVHGPEYTRLWLQYTANVLYLFQRIGSEWTNELLGLLLMLGDAKASNNIFPIPRSDGTLLYSENVERPETFIRGKYYVKGSEFRMVKIGVKQPECLLYSVPALFQYAVNMNEGDLESLKTLTYSAPLFVEIYESGMNESANSIIQIPNQVLMQSAVKSHIDQLNKAT